MPISARATCARSWVWLSCNARTKCCTRRGSSGSAGGMRSRAWQASRTIRCATRSGPPATSSSASERSTTPRSFATSWLAGRGVRSSGACRRASRLFPGSPRRRRRHDGERWNAWTRSRPALWATPDAERRHRDPHRRAEQTLEQRGATLRGPDLELSLASRHGAQYPTAVAPAHFYRAHQLIVAAVQALGDAQDGREPLDHSALLLGERANVLVALAWPPAAVI